MTHSFPTRRSSDLLTVAWLHAGIFFGCLTAQSGPNGPEATVRLNGRLTQAGIIGRSGSLFNRSPGSDSDQKPAQPLMACIYITPWVPNALMFDVGDIERSVERHVGKGCVSTRTSWWSPNP